MITARDVMHPGCAYVGINENLTDAARRMAKLDIGALPVCGPDSGLKGIITDRDIVVKAIATGKNPADVTAGDLIEDARRLWWINADADIDEVLHQMAGHKIRRLPVLENMELVGIISQADLATKLPEDKVGALVKAISGASQ